MPQQLRRVFSLRQLFAAIVANARCHGMPLFRRLENMSRRFGRSLPRSPFALGSHMAISLIP